MKNIIRIKHKHLLVKIWLFIFLCLGLFYNPNATAKEQRECFSASLTSSSLQNSSLEIPQISISKAKNSVLPLLIASIMHKGIVNLYIGDRIELLDVKAVLDTLTHLGAKISVNNQLVSIDTTDIKSITVDKDLSSRTRYSILLLGSLLSRFDYAKVGMPGGCNFKRPIDFHIKALRELGYKVNEEEGFISSTRSSSPQKVITLPYPSVGATLNSMFAAASFNESDNIIELRNCASEPEIDDVIVFLNKIGINVTRQNRTIKISGLRHHVGHTVYHTPINDRIEAGSFMLSAAILRKRIEIIGAPISSMDSVLNLLKEIGCSITSSNDSTIIDGSKINVNSSIKLSTAPYPGFPTDLQPILTVLCTTLEKPSIITEKVIPNRTDFTHELNKMGAKITTNNGVITIYPTNSFNLPNAINIKAPDLRAAMAIILFAIRNNINCKIDDFNLILRGYTNIKYKIQQIGGNLSYEQ